MSKRLLVTGARGFIGRQIVTAAVQAGYDVHAVGTRAPPADEAGPVQWHVANLLAEGEPRRLVSVVKPTHLLHAAWETSHGNYWTSPDNVLWLGTTAALAHAFASSGGQRFILVGTCAEYDWQQGVMVEGVTPNRPHTLYGACKLAAHQMLQSMTPEVGFTAATGRVFFAFGPRENAQRLIPYISRSLSADDVALLSSGRQIRDFLHVDDVANAFVVLLNSEANGAFNIGMGEPVRLSEIAQTLGQVSGRPDRIRLGARPDRSDDVPVLVPDTRRLQSLGWKPLISLERGLAETYAWWAAQE
ncbi:NAD-dependent epimerase/dehydratase family protein [Microvirga mediterraneensis]|uniref:NAD-dependent epimerase/dehydratase family protein n=1 Tax=Microvirga mediterraneensis TaxID=2754695 RepID=A0A838BTA6_9HYPH|nr:NAD-dependent epimerase/dehydratase family protein [Microvirga mediterraneensis]